jgi:hypothetical protein
MTKYRKKPVVIEAVKWDGLNIVEVYNFLEDKNEISPAYVSASGKNFYIKFDNGTCRQGSLMIETLEGDMKANVGDYIIKGVNGEFYPCKPDVFFKSYKKVEE